MTPGTCIHYTGLIGDDSVKCKAGVNYYDAFDGNTPGIVNRFPCVQYRVVPINRPGTFVRDGEPTRIVEKDRGGQQMMPCPIGMFQEPTHEQVAEHRRAAEASLKKAFAGIEISAKWRVRPKPKENRNEVVECPVCKGRLHLFQSAINGHVSGKCETEGCASWME